MKILRYLKPENYGYPASDADCIVKHLRDTLDSEFMPPHLKSFLDSAGSCSDFPRSLKKKNAAEQEAAEQDFATLQSGGTLDDDATTNDNATASKIVVLGKNSAVNCCPGHADHLRDLDAQHRWLSDLISPITEPMDSDAFIRLRQLSAQLKAYKQSKRKGKEEETRAALAETNVPQIRVIGPDDSTNDF